MALPQWKDSRAKIMYGVFIRHPIHRTSEDQTFRLLGLVSRMEVVHIHARRDNREFAAVQIFRKVVAVVLGTRQNLVRHVQVLAFSASCATILSPGNRFPNRIAAHLEMAPPDLFYHVVSHHSLGGKPIPGNPTGGEKVIGDQDSEFLAAD